MKKWLPCLLFFTYSGVFSQNEFAATAFYNDFKKIQADAREGFSKYKGNKKQGVYNGNEEVYFIKILLPLADSGRIVYPSIGNPYADFFFQTANTKKQIDLRAANLRQALITAYEKPLSARTETMVSKKNVFSDTYFFAGQDDSIAIFKSRIYKYNRRFYLTLKMMGNKE